MNRSPRPRSTRTMLRIAGTKSRGDSIGVDRAPAPARHEQRARRDRAARHAVGNTPATTPTGTTGQPRRGQAEIEPTARRRPTRTTRLRLPTRRSWWKSGIALTTASAMIRKARHERRQERAPGHRAGVKIDAAEHHPRSVRQRDDELAQAAIGPADRRRDVEDRGHAAQQREQQDRPAAAVREVDRPPPALPRMRRCRATSRRSTSEAGPRG